MLTTILFTLWTIGVCGVIAPALCSARDDLLVALGVVVLVVYGYTARAWYRHCVAPALKPYWQKLKGGGMLALLMFVVGCAKVPAGHVGIKVYLLGSEKGVETEELGVGRYWIGINEELYLFPTFTQNYTWSDNEAITFQTSEGLSVTGDIGISYYIKADRVTNVFQKYRRGVDEIADIYLRNMVRDAFNVYGSQAVVENVYGQGKTKLLEDVQALVAHQVEPIGIVVEKIYLVGSFRLPETVVKALNSKIEATQRAEQRENELREAQAEKRIAAARGQAESLLLQAKAEAEAIRVKREQLDELMVQYESVQKWNGALPQVTGGVMPFLPLKNQ